MSKEHQTKKTIRDVSRKLFAAHGYNAVSMRDIAQEAGKRPGGIYNHFPTKQAILFDMMLENLSRAYDAVIEPLPSDASAQAQLEDFVRRHLRFNIENPDDIFIAYMELRSLEPENSSAITAKRDTYEAALRTILKTGASTGAFKLSDPDIQARAILSMLGGVTVWFRQGGAQTSEDVTECYVQAALQSVGAPYSPKKKDS